MMDFVNGMNEKPPFRPLNQYGPPTIPVRGFRRQGRHGLVAFAFKLSRQWALPGASFKPVIRRLGGQAGVR